MRSVQRARLVSIPAAGSTIICISRPYSLPHCLRRERSAPCARDCPPADCLALPPLVALMRLSSRLVLRYQSASEKSHYKCLSIFPRNLMVLITKSVIQHSQSGPAPSTFINFTNQGEYSDPVSLSSS